MIREYTLTYEDIIRTISEMVNNDKITKEGLVLKYQISEYNHKKLDETLYYRSNPEGRDFEHRDVIEVELGGIDIIITKLP